MTLRMRKLHEQCYRSATMPDDTGEVGTGRWDDCNLFQRVPRFQTKRKIE